MWIIWFTFTLYWLMFVRLSSIPNNFLRSSHFLLHLTNSVQGWSCLVLGRSISFPRLLWEWMASKPNYFITNISFLVNYQEFWEKTEKIILLTFFAFPTKSLFRFSTYLAVYLSVLHQVWLDKEVSSHSG